MERGKILIATPTYDGHVTSEYVLSVRNLERSLGKQGVETELSLIGGTILHHLRNIFANMVLNDESYSHLLFVDSDMVFSPSAVEKLLQFGAPFSGCLYPARRLDLRNFYEKAKASSSFAEAVARSQPFVATNYLECRRVGERYAYPIKDGFIRTLQLGCGITLIHRSVIEKMRAQCPDLMLKKRLPEYAGLLGDCDVLRAFDPFTDDGGTPLAEDLAFCRRWTGLCRGEIWALVDENIGHVGRSIFEGRAQDHLAHVTPTVPG